MKWRHQDVLEALGLSGVIGPDGPYSSISTDTRTLEPGALYVALRGATFDGHDFLEAARHRGALAAVVAAETPDLPAITLYRVADTTKALGLLAKFRRRRFRGPVVAITGTNGKTSTKELIAAAFRTRYRTFATPANQNNRVGVPLTLLAAPADTEALVIEAGASLPGEIAWFREILAPETAVITNVAAGHLEGFGSLEAVLWEKLSITDGVPLAVVGTDPGSLVKGARERAERVITAGLGGCDVAPSAVSLLPSGNPVITIDGLEFTLPVPGRHQVGNAMLAWAIAREYGWDLAAVAHAISQVTIPGGRVELMNYGQLTILNDCYNANPHSFRAAIELAEAIRDHRRLVFVAGTMRELGDSEASSHLEIAARLVELDPDLMVAVGAFASAMAGFAVSRGDRLILAADAAEAARVLAPRLLGSELVVLKGSRGVALERIIPELIAKALPTP